MSKILVAYFSATGVTKRKAIKLSKELDADIYQSIKISYDFKKLHMSDRQS